MLIYPFSPSWYFYIIFSLLGLYFIKNHFKKESLQKKKDFIKCFNIFVIIFWLLYKFSLSKDSGYSFYIWNELPLHLCNLTCILFLIASIKDWDLLRGLCFYTGTLGILFAFLMPDANFYNVPFFSFRALGYWGYHSLMLIQSMSLITLNIIQPSKKDVRRILLLLASICFVIHGINLLLRMTVHPQANYFYTFGIPGNIIMDFLQQKIPYPFLFMLPILLPLYIVCLFICKLIQIIKQNEKFI